MGEEGRLLTHSSPATVQITLFGACITSYKQASGDEVLYIRPDAVFDKSKPISGGIPHCFPQVGRCPEGAPREQQPRIAAVHSQQLSMRCLPHASPGHQTSLGCAFLCLQPIQLPARIICCAFRSPSHPPLALAAPQFGPGPIQQHGFARNVDWEIAATSADPQPDDRDPEVQLVLTDNEYTRAMWWVA